MYERLREILTRVDELKDKQALFVLSPAEEQEWAVLLCEYQFKVQNNHPELLKPNGDKINKVKAFQIYLKNGEVLTGYGEDQFRATFFRTNRDQRDMVDFCDPGEKVRYTWAPEIKTWVLKKHLEKTT